MTDADRIEELERIIASVRNLVSSLQYSAPENAYIFIKQLAELLPCEHKDFDSLKIVAGDFTDDHTLEAVRCRNCSQWFMATVWSTDREAELVPMSPAELAQYSTLWHEVP